MTLIAKTNTTYASGVKLPTVRSSDAIANLFRLANPTVWVEAQSAFTQFRPDGKLGAVINLHNARKYVPVKSTAPLFKEAGLKSFLRFGFDGLSREDNGALVSEFADSELATSRDFFKILVFRFLPFSATGVNPGGAIIGSRTAYSGDDWWLSHFDETAGVGSLGFAEIRAGFGTVRQNLNFANSAWHSILVVNNSAECRTFVDGQAAVSHPSLAPSGSAAGVDKLKIGGEGSDAEEGFPFVGDVKAVIYSDTALSGDALVVAQAYANELRNLMNA